MNIRKILIVTLSSTALVMLPLSSGSMLGFNNFDGVGSAHAKSKNSGGNSNAGSNGKGGASNSGKSDNKGGSSASRGKSKSDKKTKAKRNGGSASNEGGFLRNLFKKPSKNKIATKSKSQTRKLKTTKARAAKIASIELADIPVPSIKPEIKDKSFNAKIAGLNSLGRIIRPI